MARPGFMLVLLIGLASCSAATPRHDPPARSPASIAGVWTRAHDGGETARLLLFDSGIMGYQRFAELPIARAYGRWTLASGTLELSIRNVEPPGQAFPLATSLAVTVDGDRLMLGTGDAQTTWTAVPRPYGTGDGADDRAKNDEADWTALVEAAPQR